MELFVQTVVNYISSQACQKNPEMYFDYLFHLIDCKDTRILPSYEKEGHKIIKEFSKTKYFKEIENKLIKLYSKYDNVP